MRPEPIPAKPDIRMVYLFPGTHAVWAGPMLECHPYLVGAQVSAAGMMNGAVMMLAGRTGLLDPLQNVQAWFERIVARPAHQCASSFILGESK